MENIVHRSVSRFVDSMWNKCY